MKKFKIGDSVKKKSGKPFKDGSILQLITDIGINGKDPNKRSCAVFSDGSICNLDMLEESLIKVTKDSSPILKITKNKFLLSDFGARGKGESIGIPTGHLSMFKGETTASLVKFLPVEIESEKMYRVFIEDIGNLDDIKLTHASCIIEKLLEEIKDIDLSKPKKRVRRENLIVIDNTSYPVIYQEDCSIIVQYPKTL